jgi:hypothetical protein
MRKSLGNKGTATSETTGKERWKNHHPDRYEEMTRNKV